MRKEELDKKLIKMIQLAKKLSEADDVPVLKYRAEMILGLLKELEVTVLNKG